MTERPGAALPGSPAEFTSVLEYNAAGDLIRHADPGGKVTTIERGRLGEAAAVIHPEGRLERTDASPLGRTVVRAASGRTAVTETSDPDGFLQQVAEQGGSTFAYGYDLAGRLTSLTQPWGGTRRYAWDADGLLAGQTLEDGTAMSDERDAAGRHVARNVVAGSATSGPARTIYVWDPAGRLAATDTGEARTTFTRDSTGAIVAETLAVGGREHTVRRTFDQAGRRVALWYARHRMATADFSDCRERFLNLNQPEDLAEVQRLLRRPGA